MSTKRTIIDISSNNGSNGSKSLQTINSSKERKYDTIPFRLDFIKDILRNNDLEPIINLENVETETFLHPNGFSYIKEELTKENESDESSYDIRSILNKKKV